MDESRLIQHARANDALAWEALVRAYSQPVFRLAYLLTGDADDAEDVAQDTFIRAHAALDRFDATRPLQPWLLQIAANLARNRRRSVRRYVAALHRALRREPSLTRQISDHSAQAWEAHTVWQAVQRLRHADQQIIYLRYFLDLSEAETAASLNVAPGTVKSRLHRAIERLRIVVDHEFPALREERYL